MFTLITSTGVVIRLPTTSAVRRALEGAANGEYWVELRSNTSDNYFVRAERIGTRDAFVLDYKFGKRDHYRTVPPEPTLSEVIDAFCGFLESESDWFFRFSYRRVREEHGQSRTDRSGERVISSPAERFGPITSTNLTPGVAPYQIDATELEVLRLPSGRSVSIPKATPVFARWQGESPSDTYGGKALLDCMGECVFAELAILRSLQHVGWSGVWIDTYRKKYRTGYWNSEPVRLSDEKVALLNRIYDRSGNRSGAFDVYCWRGTDILFAESKRRGKDSIRETQLIWLEAALAEGLPLSSFLVVEWTVS